MRKWDGFTPGDYARPAPDSTMQLLPAIAQLGLRGGGGGHARGDHARDGDVLSNAHQPALRNFLNLPRNRLYHPHEFQDILLNVLMIFPFVLQRHTCR